MSSDSSDDEPNLTLFLKEACDTQFLTESLYKSENSQKSKKTQDKINKNFENPPSLRPGKSQSDNDNFLTLKITPEFQRHVAKALGEVLDRKLEKLFENEKKDRKNKFKIKKKSNFKNEGIKLFSDSKEYIDVNDESEVKLSKKFRGYKRLIDKEKLNEEIKVKLAAVDSDFVLSKKEVGNWAIVNKGEVFRYKKNSKGNLVFIDEGFK